MMEIVGFVAIVWVFINILSSILEYFKIDEKYFKILCLKCFTFWITLLFTLNPFTAAIAALLAYLLDKFLLQKETTL